MEKRTLEPTQGKPEAAPSFEELAALQGVPPVTDFETLLGHPAAGDESAEEFSAMLREWRREGTASPHPR